MALSNTLLLHKATIWQSKFLSNKLPTILYLENGDINEKLQQLTSGKNVS